MKKICESGLVSGSRGGDLFESIQKFLEDRKIEIYRISVTPEAYQVKHNGQTVRFYIQREDRIGRKKKVLTD